MAFFIQSSMQAMSWIQAGLEECIRINFKDSTACVAGVNCTEVLACTAALELSCWI